MVRRRRSGVTPDQPSPSFSPKASGVYHGRVGCGRGGVGFRLLPMPGWQLIQFGCRLIVDLAECVGEPSLRVNAVAAARSPPRSDPAAESNCPVMPMSGRRSRSNIAGDLSPFSYPPMSRVDWPFEPAWLGAATGRGAKPPIARGVPSRCDAGALSLA